MRLPTATTHKGWDFLDWTGKTFHPGVDYNWGSLPSDDLGNPVFPYRTGKVVHVGKSKSGFGNEVVLVHNDKTYSRYAHLNDISVKLKQWVNTFEQIGTLGSTGSSTSPHLHFSAFKHSVWQLGTNFYPIGKSKNWIKQNYIDPNSIMPKTLRVKIVANDLRWESWPEKIAKVRDVFLQKTEGQLNLDISLDHSGFDITEKHWTGDFLSPTWVRRNVLHFATGYDVCVFVLPYDQWKTNTWSGYAANNEQKNYIDGIQFVTMKSSEYGKRRGRAEFEGRFVHEMCHTILDMAGIPDKMGGTDQKLVHYWDYRKPPQVFNSLHDVQFEDLKGWDIPNKTRLFKFSKRQNKIIQRIVSDEQARMFPSGINYWKKVFGFSEVIPRV